MMRAAITMFLVKLVLLLYLSSVVPEIYFGMHLYVDGFLTMISSKQIFFFLFLPCSSSPSNFSPTTNNNCERFFNIFKHDLELISMTRKMKIANFLYERYDRMNET